VAAAEPLLAAAERTYWQRSPHAKEAGRSKLWLAICRARMGRTSEAETLLRSAAEIFGKTHPPSHPERRRVDEELQRLRGGAGAAAS